MRARPKQAGLSSYKAPTALNAARRAALTPTGRRALSGNDASLSQQQHVAIHEAGHAVIARVLGISHGAASIVPSETEGTLGRCILACYDAKRMTGFILAMMAGTAAELEFFGSKIGREEIDQAWIDCRAGYQAHYHPSLPPPNWHLPRLRRQVRRLVRNHRDKIERVAETLLEQQTLTAHQVAKLLAN
jgi:cell division protease FtsH